MIRRLAALWLASACWTGAPPPPPPASQAPSQAPSPAASQPPSPTGPCPARLVGVVHDATTAAPIAGATVVVETARGRVAAEVTDARGRFETAAVRPPARLRIYHGEHAVWHPLAPCQPPLRIGVPRSP